MFPRKPRLYEGQQAVQGSTRQYKGFHGKNHQTSSLPFFNFLFTNHETSSSPIKSFIEHLLFTNLQKLSQKRIDPA